MPPVPRGHASAASGRGGARIYLDYAATTPVDPRVAEAMRPYFTDRFGNPSSVHQFGQEARAAVAGARAALAALIGAQTREVIFTSGASEANNLAIVGAAGGRPGPGQHIVTAATEHHAVLEPCHWLAGLGVDVTVLAVDRYGTVDPDAVRRAIRSDTVLVSIMHSNNEIGTIAPLAEIGAITRERGVLLHTDATQSVGILPLDVRALSVDMLSLSAHKRYGPKGVGALYLRSGVKVDPLVRGGSQERGLRGGTENTPGIVGVGEAARVALEGMAEEAARIARLRDRLAAGLESAGGAHLNGHPTDRLPGIISASFDGIDSESLLLALDLEGIAASGGSACAAGTVEPSHVIAALGVDERLARGTLRFSLGRWTTDGEIDRVLEALPVLLARVRAAHQRVR